MIPVFDKAHAFVARWEGGFAHHPSDPGGATNRGVSLRFLRSIGHDIDGDGDVDVDDIRAVTPAIAANLFHTHFWRAASCDQLPALAATVLYDGAVNMGVPRAVKQLQTACNRYQGLTLAVDGRMGPRSIDRVAHLSRTIHSQLALAERALTEREEFYRRLAASAANYKAFLGGWINRTAALYGWITAMAREGYE